MTQITDKERDGVLVRAAWRAMRFWGLTDEQAEALSGVSGEEREAASEKRLVLPFRITQDASERLGLIIAVYRDLHDHFGAQAADRWPKAPNHAPPFSGEPPLALMIREGKGGMLHTIAHLRALRQGF